MVCTLIVLLSTLSFLIKLFLFGIEEKERMKRGRERQREGRRKRMREGDICMYIGKAEEDTIRQQNVNVLN